MTSGGCGPVWKRWTGKGLPALHATPLVLRPPTLETHIGTLVSPTPNVGSGHAGNPEEPEPSR